MIQELTAPARPLFMAVHTSDFDELAQGIPGWDTVFSQLSPGPFRGELELLQLPEVTSYRIAANREILARGAHLPNTFAFSVVNQQPVSSIWSSRPVGKDQVIFLGPKGTLDHKSSAEYEAFFVEINGDAFLAAAQALTGRDVESDLAGKVLLSPSSGATNRLQISIRNILDLADVAPDSLEQSAMQRQLFHELLAQIAEVIVASYGPETSPGRFRMRRLLVQEAEALMDSHPDGALTILNLCEALCVSERGLHYAFRDMLGQTPMAFYRKKRLNAVRRLLKQHGSFQTVAEAGRVHGFWHTGQFAADYRRLFGELPSKTLAGAHHKK